LEQATRGHTLSTARAFNFTGALLAEPPHDGKRQSTLVFDFHAEYDQSLEAARHVSGTVLTPHDLDMGGVTNVYLFALRVLSGGPLTLLLDSTAGTAQEVPVSGEIFIDNEGGVPITRIQIAGTADIEFMLAGT